MKYLTLSYQLHDKYIPIVYQYQYQKVSMKKTLLNQLKKGLPKGWSVILAERCGCSEAQVSRIFDQKRDDNYGVIQEAIKLKDETEAKKKKEEEMVKKSISKK